MSRLQILVATLVLLVTVSVPVPGRHSTAEAEPRGRGPCRSGEEDVRGQGCSRRQANGLYRIRLDDGSEVESHGPDAPGTLPPLGLSRATDLPRASAGFYCAPVDRARNLLVYAVPADKADRYQLMAPEVRSMFYMAADILFDEARLFAEIARYPMACGPDGLPSVARVVLPTASSSDGFSTIVSDLKRKGFGSSSIKYWVWYDDSVASGYAGQGSIWNDDRLVSTNLNNTGPSYGITYGYRGRAGASVMLHENGHNVGAVQRSAPHSSNAWHCNDEYDVMCYADGGSTSRVYTTCTSAERYDCGHDDYFHPNPPIGTYLAGRWNVASPLNQFLTVAAPAAGEPPRAFAGEPRTVVSSPFPYRQRGATATAGDSPLFTYRWTWVGCTYAGTGSGSCPNFTSGTGSDFLSGTSASVPGPEVYLSRPGTYDLRLTVSDRAGRTGESTARITVL